MKKPKTKSQTIERAFLILDELMDSDKDIATLAARCDLTYSTAYRIINFLCQQGFLQKSDGKKFKLGSKLIQLGFRAYESTNLVKSARPYLEKLNEITQDTVHLAVNEAHEVVYMDKISGKRSVNISSRIGGRKKLHNTGVGKSLLLLKTPGDLAEIYKQEQGTPQEQQAFLDAMAAYRQKGYTLDIGEDSPNIRCVAAPIFSKSDCIVAAISVSSAAEYVSDERILELIDTVQKTSWAISNEVYGYQKP